MNIGTGYHIITVRAKNKTPKVIWGTEKPCPILAEAKVAQGSTYDGIEVCLNCPEDKCYLDKE